MWVQWIFKFWSSSNIFHKLVIKFKYTLKIFLYYFFWKKMPKQTFYKMLK